MNDTQKKSRGRSLSLGIPMGAGGGVALGVVLMTVLDHPGFFAVGIAIGLCLGTAAGLILDLRRPDGD